VRDMAKLTRAILISFPEYEDFYKLPYLQVGNRQLPNRNGLLSKYKGADGMKTGFVCSSGYNLVATAKRGGHKIAAIYLGGVSQKSRDRQVVKLLDKGFSRVQNSGTRKRATIYNSKKQSYRLALDMRSTVCAPRKNKKR
ncbi:MAG: D-alanyl-D-alanine carboxypeptidase, partial [Rhizobiales bacterium]|nr:D-alanyl-D-alanine carboxypeptidase [Hyphomicrobiales bacterium]